MSTFYALPSLRGVATVVLVLLARLYPLPSGQAQGAPECITFQETGKQLCGNFLRYWSGYGGVRRFGLPISDAIETSPATHRITQYFERTVFESPSAGGEAGSVAVESLGSERLAQKYPFRDEKRTFPETTMQGEKMGAPSPYYTLSGPFLSYWQTHGAAAWLGYPISPVLLEESELDGKEYVMQYFEGAVFEYHAEYARPNNVLLSQLGTFRHKKLFPRPEDIITGDWCGPEVKITDGTSLRFKWGASGYFDDPAVLVFGRFDAPGIYADAYVTRPSPGFEKPVHYIGNVSGDTMTFTINFDYPFSGQPKLYTATRNNCP